MIIFLGLFLIIVAISFILAYRSMQDFQEVPSIGKNGVYLIQNPVALTTDLISDIGNKAQGEVVSFERLFKGAQSALVIFGPKQVLESFAELNLLELEDYTGVPTPKLAWEMGIKNGGLELTDSPFSALPQFLTDEQLWWQLILQNQVSWQAQIRVVLVVNDPARQKELSSSLQKLAQVVKVPKPLSSEQIYRQYTKRVLSVLSQKPLLLTSEQILKLLGKS